MQKTNKQKQSPSFSNDRKIGSRQATIFLFVSSLIQTLRATRKSAPGGFFIAFGNLPKVSVDFGEVRASLREIPEVVSVRKPLTRQRTLTLENDEGGGFFVVGMAGGGTASAGGVYCLLLTTAPPTSPPSFPQDAGIQSPRMADHRLPCALLKTLDSRLKDCGNGVVGTQRQLAGDSRGRKCPVSRRLKEKARRQRTLTLENDGVGEFFVVGTTNTTNTVTPK